MDTEGHGGLFLVEEEARPILRGERPVVLHQETALHRHRAPGSCARNGEAAVAAFPGADTRYEALRLWRLAEAKGQGIPPYVIFHDSVLRDIAALRPTTLDELAQIKGVGGKLGCPSTVCSPAY